MTQERQPQSSYEEQLDPARLGAIQELTDLVSARWPTATFRISPGEDNPEATHIFATVDVDDPDEVVDVVIDRMLSLQIDQGIPVHLVPLRTPERTAALRRQLAGRDQHVPRPAL